MVAVAADGVADPGVTLPDDEQLRTVLSGLLKRPSLQIVGRQPNVFTSTLPTEILEVADGARYRRALFAKYYPPAGSTIYGRPLRGDVEAAVGALLLPRTGLPHAKLVGTELIDGSRWLFTERMTGPRLSKVESPTRALVAAARWIGSFHAVFSGDDTRERFPLLPEQDAPFLTSMGERARETNPHLVGIRWFEHTTAAFATLLEGLFRVPRTVVHGEYYPKNILVQDGVVIPVDWETAAVGPGVLDVAMLTEDWPPSATRRAEAAYRRARYGSTEVPGWRAAVRVARMAVQLQALAVFELPASHPHVRKLRRAAGEAGLA